MVDDQNYEAQSEDKIQSCKQKKQQNSEFDVQYRLNTFGPANPGKKSPKRLGL